MATHFRSTERNERFDRRMSWLFIQRGETKLVDVVDAERMQITCWHSDVARMTEIVDRGSYEAQVRRIQIVGQSPGTARITAGTTELEVTVGERIKVPISFHRVRDNYGHKAKRTLQNATPLLNRAKHIVTSQTGVDFVVTSMTEVTVPCRLGRGAGGDNRPHKWPSTGEWEWQSMKQYGDSSARCRVFFVEHTGSGAYGVTYKVGDPHILIQDHAGLHEGQTLAHELCHSLGLDHYNGPPDWLMNKDPRGNVIPKDQAAIVRQGAR
jgi:hypothetical protein